MVHPTPSLRPLCQHFVQRQNGAMAIDTPRRVYRVADLLTAETWKPGALLAAVRHIYRCPEDQGRIERQMAELVGVQRKELPVWEKGAAWAEVERVIKELAI